jgi:DMSO/TMAO reductase YedYZ heme-binding membrane subunit
MPAAQRPAPQQRAPMTVIIIAVLVPLVPIAFWINSFIEMMPAALQSAELGFYMLARVFALTGFVLIFYQFVLTSRLPFLEARLKRPKMVKTHRTVGKVGFLLVLAHGVILLVLDPTLYLEKTLGLIGLILLATAVIAAWFFKPLKLSLKTWRAIHLIAYVVLPIVFIHAMSLGLTVAAYRPVWWLFVAMFAGYCLIVVYRIVRLLRERRPSPRKA